MLTFSHLCMASIIEHSTTHKTEMTSLANWREVRGQGSGQKKTQQKAVRKSLRDEAAYLTSILADRCADPSGSGSLSEDPTVLQGGALKDLSDCNALAHVHESLEWVAMKMGRLLKKVTNPK